MNYSQGWPATNLSTGPRDILREESHLVCCTISSLLGRTVHLELRDFVRNDRRKCRRPSVKPFWERSLISRFPMRSLLWAQNRDVRQDCFGPRNATRNSMSYWDGHANRPGRKFPYPHTSP